MPLGVDVDLTLSLGLCCGDFKRYSLCWREWATYSQTVVYINFLIIKEQINKSKHAKYDLPGHYYSPIVLKCFIYQKHFV